MTGQPHLALNASRQVPVHDLSVVKVELQSQIWRTHLGNHVQRVLLMIEPVARDIAWIDWLDQNRAFGLKSLFGCPTQVLKISRAHALANTLVAPGRGQSRHHV